MIGSPSSYLIWLYPLNNPIVFLFLLLKSSFSPIFVGSQFLWRQETQFIPQCGEDLQVLHLTRSAVKKTVVLPRKHRLHQQKLGLNQQKC